MKKKTLAQFISAGALLLVFILFTVSLKFVDVRHVDRTGSQVAYGGINEAFHKLTGVNWTLYDITDVLGIAVIVVLVGGFGVLGLFQLIKRKSLLKVDRSILVLGGFYVLVLGAFLLFEVLRVNYRPVLVEGVLEASYPSSTTMLACCVLPTAMMQFKERIGQRALMITVNCFTAALTAFMVIARVISGVHWLTDIVGGLMLSASLVLFYCTANGFSRKRRMITSDKQPIVDK